MGPLIAMPNNSLCQNAAKAAQALKLFRNMVSAQSIRSPLGRWINRDPLQLEGDTNLYQYAFNSPIWMSDPVGERPVDVNLGAGDINTTAPPGVIGVGAEGQPGQLFGVGYSAGLEVLIQIQGRRTGEILIFYSTRRVHKFNSLVP